MSSIKSRTPVEYVPCNNSFFNLAFIGLPNTSGKHTNYCPLVSISISISHTSNPFYPANPSCIHAAMANICWPYLLLFMAEHLLTAHLSGSYDIGSIRACLA